MRDITSIKVGHLQALNPAAPSSLPQHPRRPFIVSYPCCMRHDRFNLGQLLNVKCLRAKENHQKGKCPSNSFCTGSFITTFEDQNLVACYATKRDTISAIAPSSTIASRGQLELHYPLATPPFGCARARIGGTVRYADISEKLGPRAQPSAWNSQMQLF